MKVVITIDDEAGPALPGHSLISVKSDPSEEILGQSVNCPPNISHWSHMIALTALEAIRESMAEINVQPEETKMTEIEIGDIVQYGCSPHEVLMVDDPQDGDYAHVEIKCIEANDEWLDVGEVSQTFAGRVALLRKRGV